MSNTAKIASGLAAIMALQGRRVQLTHKSGTVTTGTLTKILYRHVETLIGAQRSWLPIPYSVELDGETEYTHAFAGIVEIEAV